MRHEDFAKSTERAKEVLDREINAIHSFTLDLRFLADSNKLPRENLEKIDFDWLRNWPKIDQTIKIVD